MPLPSFLKPKKTYKLERFGKDNDGGYLIGSNSIKKTKNLISLGIYDDWSFEKKFSKLNRDINILCFDDQTSVKFLVKKILNNCFLLFFNFELKKFILSIVKLFEYIYISKQIKFTKKKIKSGDLEKITENLKNLFIKIDIEGSEYRIFEDLLKIQDKIVCLVIEFHDIDLHMDKIEKFINEIKLELIHIHPNNFCDLDSFGNPTTIEVSFENNPIIEKDLLTIPHNLDQNCNPNGPDINISFQN
mgnify:CR=1 FL=1|tara:strand:+ start:274 stop:1008 length:735 start_codon:yes stop_codon:yes gene_type:complete